MSDNEDNGKGKKKGKKKEKPISPEEQLAIDSFDLSKYF